MSQHPAAISPGAGRSRIVSFAQEELGLELRPGQAAILAAFEQGRFSQAVWQCGRRGGKSTIADVLALYDAVAQDHLRAHLLPGEPRVAAIVSPKLDQAQRHITRCARLARNSRRLAAMIVGETSDELSFSNGSVIAAYPASARSLRGDAWSCAILDELGHFITSDDGNAAGDRILEAAQPSLAQFAQDGWLIAISTPLWRLGAFHKLAERAQSGRFPSMHFVHKSTAQMNDRISTAWLEEQRRADPELYAREYLAQFIDGASSYLASADVVASVRKGRNILEPQPGLKYTGSLDPGYSMDRFAFCVGHTARDRLVIDGVWTWYRQGHERVIAEIAELARAYRITSLRTDQLSAEPVRESLARHGLHADYKPWSNESKSNAFSALKLALSARTVELPDDSGLIEELCGLEARPTPAGFTRIAAAGGGHDDRAIAVAAVVEVLRPKLDTMPLVAFAGMSTQPEEAALNSTDEPAEDEWDLDADGQADPGWRPLMGRGAAASSQPRVVQTFKGHPHLAAKFVRLQSARGAFILRAKCRWQPGDHRASPRRRVSAGGRHRARRTVFSHRRAGRVRRLAEAATLMCFHIARCALLSGTHRLAKGDCSHRSSLFCGSLSSPVRCRRSR